MRIQISSWNAQGGFRYKSDCLGRHLNNRYYYNVLLVQEQGVPGTTGYALGEEFNIGKETYQCVLCETDETAKVFRCTTAIMVEEGLLGQITDLGWHTESVSRPLCWINLWGILRIAGFHAVANDSLSVYEVRKMLGMLDAGDPPFWVFMGDFNSNPTRYPLYDTDLRARRINEIQYAGSHDRNQQYCNLLYSGEPTQGADGNRDSELDFAFSSNSGVSIGGIQNRLVYRRFLDYPWPVSDHNMITVRASI